MPYSGDVHLLTWRRSSGHVWVPLRASKPRQSMAFLGRRRSLSLWPALLFGHGRGHSTHSPASPRGNPGAGQGPSGQTEAAVRAVRSARPETPLPKRWQSLT